MKPSNRSLIGAGTAVAVFLTSWAVTAAVTAPADAVAVDEPIEVPAATIEQATVLSPVQIGEFSADAGHLDLGLSERVGTAQVVVLDDDDDSELPAGTIPPEILAAAAALDAAAGDPADTMDVTPADGDPSSPSLSPAPAPSPDPASDPCAVIGSDEADCPEGVTGTLFALRPGEALEVYGAADPPVGPDMGSTNWCEPVEVPEGALRLGAFANDEASVTITYWPVDDPSAMESASLTQVQVFSGGESRHCGQTLPLREGRYEGTAFGINPDGVISTARPLSFDSRGRPTEPEMRVIPLGTNWLWAGVYHRYDYTATLKGFTLEDGGPATCEAARPDSVPGLRFDVWPHTSEVPRSWLDARNYDSAHARVTSALFYVPEGTTAGICGLSFAEGDPSWDLYEPERVQLATVEAPDTYEAVVTLRDITAYRPGLVTLSATGQTGYGCGTRFSEYIDIEPSDRPITQAFDQELCAIAGQNVQLAVETLFEGPDGATDSGRSGARFLLMGEFCTGVCPEPAPQTYTVFLPGLGQDECPDSGTGECEVRRRTAGAVARIDVTWQANGDGERSDWGVSGTSEAPYGSEPSETIQFDTSAFLTTALSPDGFTASASTTLRWDRDVTYSAQVHGDCFAGTPGAAAPAPTTGRATPAGTGVFAAPLNLTNLCPGYAYQVVVTATDLEGNVHVAAPAGTAATTPDALWSLGSITTPQRYLEVTVKAEIFKNDRITTSWLVRDSFVDVGPVEFNPRFGPTMRERCFPGSQNRVGSDPATRSVPLAATYDVAPTLNVFTDWHYLPQSASCDWRASDEWIVLDGATVTHTELLEGVELTGRLVYGYDPTFEETPPTFTYRVVLRAEWVED